MKEIALQIDIVKAADKQERGGKRSPFMYGQTEDSIGIIVNGNYLVFIRKDRFYLSPEKAFPDTTPLDIKKLIVEDPYYALPATDTGIVRTIQDGKKVKIFTTEKADIWIDETYFKYFDLSNATFKGSEKNKPIYIYEDDIGERLVGMVLPVYHV